MNLLDPTDRQIIDCVIENPSVTVEGLVRYLDEHGTQLSESAVGKRLAELTKNQLKRAILVDDWAAAGYPFKYRIDIKADMKELRLGRGGPVGDPIKIETQKKLGSYIKETLGPKYAGRLIILEATITLGQYDLFLTVRVKDPNTLLEFVTEDLRTLGGVADTFSSHEAWSYGEPG